MEEPIFEIMTHTQFFIGSIVEHLLIYILCMAGNFGGKIFWQIAENMSFDRIYFGS